MRFLDHLENDYRRWGREASGILRHWKRERMARHAEKALAIQIGPHAEALRNGPFTAQLLTACRTVGHGLRKLVRVTWVEATLRLEAGEKKLELRPTPHGVVAVFFKDGVEQRSEAKLSMPGRMRRSSPARGSIQAAESSYAGSGSRGAS